MNKVREGEEMAPLPRRTDKTATAGLQQLSEEVERIANRLAALSEQEAAAGAAAIGAANDADERRDSDRVAGSVPALQTKDVKTFRAKVFKSGNSLALRLPAELGLAAGVEMELRADGSGHFSFEPVQQARRKLNVAAFWGKATGLKPIAPGDRVFEERKLDWNGDRLNEDG